MIRFAPQHLLVAALGLGQRTLPVQARGLLQQAAVEFCMGRSWRRGGARSYIGRLPAKWKLVRGVSYIPRRTAATKYEWSRTVSRE